MTATPPPRAQAMLEDAILTLMGAQQVWGCWADEIRQQAEKRLGAGPASEAVLSDPAYGAALDAGRPYGDALRHAESSLGAIDPECLAAAKAGKLRALLLVRAAGRRER